MRIGRSGGLDELMIVSHGHPGSEPLFLGEDGTTYQEGGLGREEELEGLGQFFLGGDHSLYRVHGLGLKDRFFLGEDGTLYEVLR